MVPTEPVEEPFPTRRSALADPMIVALDVMLVTVPLISSLLSFIAKSEVVEPTKFNTEAVEFKTICPCIVLVPAPEMARVTPVGMVTVPDPLPIFCALPSNVIVPVPVIVPVHVQSPVQVTAPDVPRAK